MKGKLVVVGGHSRRVGKTSVMRAILRALPEMNWHAVKISSHQRHRTGTGSADSIPNLLRLSDSGLRGGLTNLAELLAEGRNLLVESNRITSHLWPDLVVFVVDPLSPDWKDSSAACLDHANALVFSQDGPCPAQLLALQRLLPAFRLTHWDSTPFAFDEWLRERIAATEATSDETSVPVFQIHGSEPPLPGKLPRRMADGPRARDLWVMFAPSGRNALPSAASSHRPIRDDCS